MENVYGILDVKEEASLQKHLNLMHWHVLIFLSLHHHASDSVLRFGKRCKSSARRTCCASSRSTVPTLAIQQVEEESTLSWFEGPSSCCQIKNQNRFASNLSRDVAAKSINAHIALEKHCQSVYTKLKMDYAPAIEPPLSSNDTNQHFCVWCLELSSLSRLRSQLLLPADCNYLKAVQTELASKAAATSRNRRKTHYDLTIRFFSCNECILCSFVHLQPGTLRPTQKRPVWLRKHWAKMKAHKARHLTMKNVQSLTFPTFICLLGWTCKAERMQTCSWHFPFAASLSCDPAEWTCKLSVCVFAWRSYQLQGRIVHSSTWKKLRLLMCSKLWSTGVLSMSLNRSKGWLLPGKTSFLALLQQRTSGVCKMRGSWQATKYQECHFCLIDILQLKGMDQTVCLLRWEAWKNSSSWGSLSTSFHCSI